MHGGQDMKPLLLIIRQKFEVPSITQRVHKTKLIWKERYRLDYSQTPQFLKSLGGVIENDAQFANWLKTTFGVGDYQVNAWMIGKEGFWSFIRILCNENDYCRIKRKDKKIRKELNDYKLEVSRLKVEQDSTDDSSAKIDLQKEIDVYENAAKNIEDESNPTTKYGTAGYLKAVQPLYKPHFYQEFQ
jgi:hypothetical protein